MDLIDICNILEKENLPIPVKQCDNCGNTIYRHGCFYRCCNCGATSTQFGGLFTHTLFKDVGVDQEWIDNCNKSKKRIEELKISKYGYFSKKAEMSVGSIEWIDESGNKVKVTCVGNSENPKESGYLFDDAICVGRVLHYYSGVLKDKTNKETYKTY